MSAFHQFEAGAAARRDFPIQYPPCKSLRVRMPNWLGDVVMAAPIVRMVRAAHPDTEVSLVAKAAFAPLLTELGLAEKIIVPPSRRGLGYWRFFRGLRHEKTGAQVMFTNSFRGDLEAWLSGARRRMGIVRSGKWRPLLTHGWRFPKNLAEDETHQTRLWAQWWAEAGLLTADAGRMPDLTPFRLRGITRAPSSTTPVIGLICGSENSPAKRWPVTHWRVLITQLLTRHSAKFRLFGTPGDAVITREVARGMPAEAIEDMAGKTDLLQFARALAECHCVAGNDTGGLHLANMLGVPVAGIYGPTNPVRTGPAFAAPAIILEPRFTSEMLAPGPVFVTTLGVSRLDAASPGEHAPVSAVSPARVVEACELFLRSEKHARFLP